MGVTPRDAGVRRAGGVDFWSAWPVLTLCAVAAFAIYLPGLPGWAFTDDFHHLKGALTGTRAFEFFYRPLEQGVVVFSVRQFGTEDVTLIRLFGLAGFLVTIALTYAFGRFLLRSRATAAFAAGFVATSSLSAPSLVQIDTLSQQQATLFPLLFLFCLLAARLRSSRPLYLSAFVCALLALLAKESSPGIVAVTPLAALLIRPPPRADPGRVFRTLLGDYSGVALVVAVYAALRFGQGIAFGGDVELEQYALKLSPSRLATNLTLYLGSLLYVGGSTLDVFPTVKPGRALVSGLLTGVTLAVSLLGAVRLARMGRAGLPLLGFLLLAGAGAFPVALTARIPELYGGGSVPFLALLLGLAFPAGVGVVARRSRAGRLYPAATVFAALLFVWSGLGASEKVLLTKTIGEESLRYFKQTQAFLTAVPDGPLQFCWASPFRPPTYGTLVMSPQHVASRAMDFAAWLEGRAFYLARSDGTFEVQGASEGEWLRPPAPYEGVPVQDPARVEARGCTHQLRADAGELRFVAVGPDP